MAEWLQWVKRVTDSAHTIRESFVVLRSVLSYAVGVRAQPGDVFKLDVPVFGRPLRNTLRRAEPEAVTVEPL